MLGYLLGSIYLIALSGAGEGISARLSQEQPLADRIAELVTQLDAPQLVDRQKAEKQLLELGSPILPHLPSLDDPLSPEVRTRLARIRQTLEKVAARQYLEASSITLSGTFSLGEVLTALEKQSGNRLELSALADAEPTKKLTQPLTVRFEKLPFWVALDSVLKESQLGRYLFGPERAIVVLSPVDPGNEIPEGAVAYQGPFRVEALRIEARRGIARPLADELIVQLQVAWEPRLAPVAMYWLVERTQAWDDISRRLAPLAPGARVELMPSRSGCAVEVPLKLELPPRDSRSLSRLQGAFRFLIPGWAEKFRFSRWDLRLPQERRVADVLVRLEMARRLQEEVEIEISVRFQQPYEALESHRTWIFDNPAFLETPDNNRLTPTGYEPTLQLPHQVGIRYRFPWKEPLDNCTFVYITPVTIVPAEFSFTLGPLPLP